MYILVGPIKPHITQKHRQDSALICHSSPGEYFWVPPFNSVPYQYSPGKPNIRIVIMITCLGYKHSTRSSLTLKRHSLFNDHNHWVIIVIMFCVILVYILFHVGYLLCLFETMSHLSEILVNILSRDNSYLFWGPNESGCVLFWSNWFFSFKDII